MTDSKWMTITQFSSELGLSRYTVVNLIKTGRLQVFNISPGGKRPTYRLPKTQLSKALDLMKSTAPHIDSHGGEDGAVGEVEPKAAV